MNWLAFFWVIDVAMFFLALVFCMDELDVEQSTTVKLFIAAVLLGAVLTGLSL